MGEFRRSENALGQAVGQQVMSFQAFEDFDSGGLTKADTVNRSRSAQGHGNCSWASIRNTGGTSFVNLTETDAR